MRAHCGQGVARPTATRPCRRSPIFVFPVNRDGGFFNLLSQFQDQYCLMTYLEDYKKNPAMAMPYMTVTMYEDLLEDKGLVLVRADYGLHLSGNVRGGEPPRAPPHTSPFLQEAKRILGLLQLYYTSPVHYELVNMFNNRPEEFDFDAYLREVSQQASE